MSARSQDRPRRSRVGGPAPETPAGWRQTRRGSKASKKAKRQLKRYETKESIASAARVTQRTVRDVLVLLAMGIGWLLAFAAVLLLVIIGVNRFARWNAVRVAERENSPQARVERSRDNLLIIGLDEKGAAKGFLALRLDSGQDQIYGIAIPDGAFIEVPGQGFERIGESWNAGHAVSLDAVSNFFTVPFTGYAAVDYSVYQNAMKAQSLEMLLGGEIETNLTDADRERFALAFDKTSTENVALVPLPVKPITLGSQTYFEPQRKEVADLVETWWGVRIDDAATVTRVIVYNGAGIPGIAGQAAQRLIRAGYRVVDTRNADRFDYATTRVIVQNGPAQVGTDVAETLGVGEVLEQPADQKVADIIIIIGKDYTTPAP